MTDQCYVTNNEEIQSSYLAFFEEPAMVQIPRTQVHVWAINSKFNILHKLEVHKDLDEQSIVTIFQHFTSVFTWTILKKGYIFIYLFLLSINV